MPPGYADPGVVTSSCRRSLIDHWGELDRLGPRAEYYQYAMVFDSARRSKCSIESSFAAEFEAAFPGPASERAHSKLDNIGKMRRMLRGS